MILSSHDKALEFTCIYIIGKLTKFHANDLRNSIKEKSPKYYMSTTVGVSNKHRLVNLYLYALGSDGALKDTRFILVRAEYPYVQFVAARVISTVNGL